MITRDRCCGFSKKCAIITGAVVSVVITIAVIVIVVLMTQNSGTTGGQGADVSSIISGTDTKFEDYPFYADLFVVPTMGGDFACGASMITSKHALTAQHCVLGGVGIGSRVLIGGSVERTVVKVDNLDNYDNDSSNGNDLSILELNEPVTQEDFSFDYSPINICEDKKFTTTGTKMLIVGNGRDDVQDSSSFPDTLQKLGVVTATGGICDAITTDSLVCLEPEKGTGTSGACYGDSGGPLIYNGCLAGVSSLIFGDCGKGAFAYVSTYEHRNWIVENTEAPCICVNGWKEKEESGKALVQMDFGNNYTTAYLSCAEWKGYTSDLDENQCNLIKNSTNEYDRFGIDTCCR